MIQKHIDYKKRLRGAFEVILKLLEKNKPSTAKNITRIIKAQLKNLDGVVNKDTV